MLLFHLFLGVIVPVLGAELARRYQVVNTTVLVLPILRQTIGYESLIGLDDDELTTTTPSATPTDDDTSKQVFVKPAPQTDADDGPQVVGVTHTVLQTRTSIHLIVPTGNEQEDSPPEASPAEPHVATTTSSRRPLRETVVLDQFDRPVSTMKPAPSYKTVIEDYDGNPISTYTPAPSYRTVIRDDDGNPISTLTPILTYKTVVQQGGVVVETIKQGNAVTTPEPFDPEVGQVTNKAQQPPPSISWNVDTTTFVTHRPVTAIVESMWYVETVAVMEGGQPITKTRTTTPEVEVTQMADTVAPAVEVTQTIDEIDTIDITVMPPVTVTVTPQRALEASTVTVTASPELPAEAPPTIVTVMPPRPTEAVAIYSTIKTTTSRYLGARPMVQRNNIPQPRQEPPLSTEDPSKFQCYPELSEQPQLNDTDELRNIINEFCYGPFGGPVHWDAQKWLKYECKNLVEASDDRRITMGVTYLGYYPALLDPPGCVANLTYPLQHCPQGGSHVSNSYLWSLRPFLNNVEGEQSGCEEGVSPLQKPRRLARRAVRNKLGVMSLIPAEAGVAGMAR